MDGLALESMRAESLSDGSSGVGSMRSSLGEVLGGVSLYERLERDTARAHAAVLRSDFWVDLFGGGTGGLHARVQRAGKHVRYLHQQLAIYSALEEAFQAVEDRSWVRELAVVELWRSFAVETDLAYFRGERLGPQAPLCRATTLYIDRIREVATERPALLASHAYTRLALDVLPGPKLVEDMSRLFDAQPGMGSALYLGVEQEERSAFKWELMRRFDTCPLVGEERDELILEAQLGFRLSGMVLEGLARGQDTAL